MDLIFSPQLLASALVTGALYGLLAIGLNVIYGTMRLLNIAHGELVMLGGYVVYWSSVLLALPPPFGVVLAAAVMAVFGLALHRTILRPITGSDARLGRIEASSLLIFFGVSVILQNGAALLFSASPRALSYLDDVVEIAGVRIGADRLTVIVTGLVVSLGAAALFRFTRLGAGVRAIIQQREAAALIGIDIGRLNAAVFAFGFALAGLAGGLVAFLTPISPFMGFPYTIAAFVVIILGGLGNLGGGLIAALLLGAIETYGVALTSPSARSILIYGVFIAVILIRPQGLFGGAVRR